MNPLDPEIGIDWPTVARDGTPLEYELSAKDRVAPILAEALRDGMLPSIR